MRKFDMEKKHATNEKGNIVVGEGKLRLNWKGKEVARMVTKYKYQPRKRKERR